MNVIVCVDDSGGMMFNNRRQSHDKNVLIDIIQLCGQSSLNISAYSSQLFEKFSNIVVSDDFLEMADKNDFCFVENYSLIPFEDKISKLIIYHWNKTYPADFYFDIDLNKNVWKLESSTEFTGTSHEKITREVYIK